MKAKPVVYEGIHFRSKLEARWYIFMKKLGWIIEYEPEIEGLYGWLPDFLIIGEKHKTLVDVKPIQRVSDWEDIYYEPIMNDKGGHEKCIRHKKIIRSYHQDYNKIMNSGIKNLHDYELLILGTNLQLDSDDSMGIFYERINPEKRLERNTHIIFSRAGHASKSGIGFMTMEGNWVCRISGVHGKCYLHRENSWDEKNFKMIDTFWNEAQTELRWKGNEVV